MEDFLRSFEETFERYIIGKLEIPESPEKYGDFDGFHSQETKTLLSALGFRLYVHQAKALELLYSGKNVLVTTPTSSGKSEIFRLFIIDHLIHDPTSTFLLVYPTRALLYDQYEKLKDRFETLRREVGVEISPSIEIFLGDLSRREKSQAVKRRPNIILTTVDNLHFFLLKNHVDLHYFFKNLKLVVVDEIHTYRGVFGTNSAYVFRRLFRILEGVYKNKSYRVLGLSATLKNGKEFAQKLFGKEFEIISESGHRRYKRWFYLVDPGNVSGRAILSRMIHLLVEYNIKSLVFLESKKGVELASLSIRDENKAKFISPYKGSLTKEDRREIERRFKAGELKVLITTSALELGIDIGDVQAVINYGVPVDGLFSLLQRFGRAGRGSEAINILILKKDSLDFYYRLNKEELFDKIRKGEVENLPLNLDNERVIKRHLLYLTNELGRLNPEVLTEVERKYLEDLIKGGWLEEKKDPFFGKSFYKLKRIPKYTSLRSISEKIYYLVEYDPEIEKILSRTRRRDTAIRISYMLKSRRKILEEMDSYAFYNYLLPGMVYYSLGRSYRSEKIISIEEFNFVLARRINGYYETFPLYTESVDIVETHRYKKFGDWKIYQGKILVSRQYLGYVEKLKYFGESHEYRTEYYDEPIEYKFETDAIWIVMPENYKSIEKEYWNSLLNKVESLSKKHGVEPRIFIDIASSIDKEYLFEKYRGYTTRKVYEIIHSYFEKLGINDKKLEFYVKKLVDAQYSFRSGLHAIEHNIIKISPIVTNVDSKELGGYSYEFYNKHPFEGLPVIFIYEGYEGGTGLSDILFEKVEELIRKSREILYSCKCKDGCPRCILSPKCGNFNEFLDKYSARLIYKVFFKKLSDVSSNFQQKQEPESNHE